jgi:quercetin dioxygenase-like cupin family protein
MEHLVKRADARTTRTPNATMTTLASPTLGATSSRSLWLVEMAAGATGPIHVFDTEQIWTVIDGNVAIEIEGVDHPLDTGDTLVIPAGAERQVHATTACRMLVTGDATATASVPGESESRGTPAWIS